MENGAKFYKKDFTMAEGLVTKLPLPEFSLWDKMKSNRKVISFDLEITARCNNNCRHCYINLPAGDKIAKEKELSQDKIKDIAGQAVSLGAVWCLITGGEPLLREDFFDIYLSLKKAGLLVSVFTNATLINKKHVEFFKKYPPRDIEVSVYGVDQEIYESVTRNPGSFKAFMKGLGLLLENDIKMRFKAMAINSNVDYLEEIKTFCKARTKDYFRFDPFLHLRFDGDRIRNEEIRRERLAPSKIVDIERSDKARLSSLEKNCDKLIYSGLHRPESNCTHIFYCGAGNKSFTVSYDGLFRLCSSLYHPGCIYDLKKGTVLDAWKNFVLEVRDIRSNKKEFLEKCKICPLVNLCLWCPAHAHLETDSLDKPVDYFCEVAHAREAMLSKK